MSKTSTSFTIIDYTDGINLITRIDYNLPQVVAYDTENEVLTPSWAVSPNLILTPQVYKAGEQSPVSLISSLQDVEWSYKLSNQNSYTPINPSTPPTGFSINTTSKVLTVSVDLMVQSITSASFKFSASYTDPILNLEFPIEMQMTFTRVSNGTSLVVARAWSVTGREFQNGTGTITLKAELLRGSTKDTSQIDYQWKYYDTTLGDWTDVPTTYSGYNTDTLTVLPAYVDGQKTFRCDITDTAVVPNVTYHSEGISVTDVTDTWRAEILSTGGNIFKDSTQTSILICKVWEGNTEVDMTGTNLTYTWTKTDKDGDPVVITSPSYPGVTYTSGGNTYTIPVGNHKALAVANNDVDVKATYFCDIS